MSQIGHRTIIIIDVNLNGFSLQFRKGNLHVPSKEQFLYKTAPVTKAMQRRFKQSYLKPSRTSTMERFCENI